MTNQRHNRLAALLLLLGACASHQPLFVAEDFGDTDVRTIAVLPVQDVRADPSTKLDLEKDLREPLMKRLAKHGYEPIASDTPGTGPFQVQKMTNAALARLGEATADATLVVFLEDAVYRYYVLGKKFKIELSAKLLQRGSGRELWRDKIVRTDGQGGLISGLIPVKSGVLSATTNLMISGIPKRVAPKERK